MDPLASILVNLFFVNAAVLVSTFVIHRRIFRQQALEYIRTQGGVWLAEDWDLSRRFDPRHCSVTYADKHHTVRKVKALYIRKDERYRFTDSRIILDTTVTKVPGSLDPIELDRKRLQRQLAKLEAIESLKKRNAAQAVSRKIIRPVPRKPR